MLLSSDQLKKELKKQQKEQEADLRGEPLVAMEMGALGKNAGPLVSDPGDGHSDQCNCQANRPVDVNSFIIDFVHKNHGRLNLSLSALCCILQLICVAVFKPRYHIQV